MTKLQNVSLLLHSSRAFQFDPDWSVMYVFLEFCMFTTFTCGFPLGSWVCQWIDYTQVSLGINTCVNVCLVLDWCPIQVVFLYLIHCFCNRLWMNYNTDQDKKTYWRRINRAATRSNPDRGVRTLGMTDVSLLFIDISML